MVQIAFLTLFLGLAAGPQPVELAVRAPAGQPVAAVEILLDGTPAARLAGPPWRAQLDFGADLLPHELVARALDAQGGELARVRQWINLPRSPAEVEVVVEAGTAGAGRTARLSWQSLDGREPESVTVTFDGRPLALGKDRRVTLPTVDLGVAHVLSVEVRFSAALVARRDLVVGGGGGEVSTELTAVPLLAGRGRLPPVGELRLTAAGRPLTVAAVEEGAAQLVVVRDLGTREAFHRLGSLGRRLKDPTGRTRSDPDYLRHDLTLGREDRVRLLWPSARRVEGAGLPAELFDASRDFTARDGGLYWILTRVSHPGEQTAGQRFADAVAVAGLQTLAGNGPRAVLLVLGKGGEDASRLTPAQVRRYLAAVRVPLYVWSLVPPRSSASAQAWGGATDVSTLAGLRSAVARLQRDLAGQHIVWVDGLHLPQSIALAPGGPAGLEIAGAAAP
jgi:hypothetical protein